MKQHREIIKHDWGHISYNPNTDQGAETAIVIEDDKFYILLGKWHELLEKDLTEERAMEIFTQNADMVSPWSN